MYQASNDILALEYLKNIRALKPVAVQRQGAGYHETDSPEKEFWSSTGIRKAISENRLPENRVPWSSEKLDFHISEEKWFQGIRYAILMKTPEELDSAPGGGEGLGNRLKEAARKAQSLDELILNTKSKRYTYTRISRWLYQILLGITVELQNPCGYWVSARAVGKFFGKPRETNGTDCLLWIISTNAGWIPGCFRWMYWLRMCII